jgi:hypothetical protein
VDTLLHWLPHRTGVTSTPVNYGGGVCFHKLPTLQLRPVAERARRDGVCKEVLCSDDVRAAHDDARRQLHRQRVRMGRVGDRGGD